MELLQKTNLAKTDPTYYSAKKTPQILQLGEYPYLTISGQCAPEDPAFWQAIEAIYAYAYAIKFSAKANDMDFVVPKMECQWWISGGLEAQHLFTQTPREEWHWKIAIRMPDFIEPSNFEQASSMVSTKKAKSHLPLQKVNYELIDLGECIQILHVGSYEEELPSIEKMISCLSDSAYAFAGYHTEIYLSDPRRTPEPRRKTILRYQVKPQN
ncbi:GyrI-like domain-containing protein [Marinoscillum furvescens]|uniref:GyrI-like small molecule binding domain-containing protein n=1 Tax=Marinoscillum furvescens DSM 4134 TaxID=1122208 RepID=A0A3D9LIY9_MARFU|nr:GyrI-like domain-containing protein [Marinoscillum furvescens]REE05835.1 hypothetical protein C7460_101354 [Marinoscillum furvescens DSM 4134]